MSSNIKPFDIDIPDSEIQRLYRKLKDTRVPIKDIVPGAGADYGFTTEWATSLYSYWLNSYSWPKALSQMKLWNHYTTDIEDINVHFVHQRSSHNDAIPILMVHGWPGSFYEFNDILPLLTNGDNGQQSFHCVVPSLPGFCWSSGPPRGWTMKDTARIFNELMQQLGYQKYCCQAGDWGQFVARELGAKYSDACRLVHLNYCPGALPEGVAPNEREAKARDKGVDWRMNHVGYAVMMRTRPHTVGWMLQDSPVGLMTFVGEKVGLS